MTPTRVVHLTTVDLSLRFLVFPQLRAVVEAGGEAIGISAPGPWVEGLERDGIRHVALESSTRGFDLRADVRAARQLWKVLRALRPEVVHTHNPKPGLYGRIVARLAGVPIVVNTVHGLYATPEDGRSKRAVVYALEAIASRCSDAELIQNPEDLELMTRLHIVRPERARFLGNGVDLSRFSAARFTAGTRERLRAEVGLTPEHVVIGTVGRLVAEKGHRELFEACSSLGEPFRLVVVGAADPEKPDALSRDELDRAAEAGVIFLGHRDDVDAWYCAMDVFALASHREGFPRAAMEAAAMGLPIVATDIRGCRQVVQHGRNGLLAPVGDVSALRRALQTLGLDPSRRAHMGREARSIAVEEFDEQRCVDRVMATYEEVAHRKRRPLGLRWPPPALRDAR